MRYPVTWNLTAIPIYRKITECLSPSPKRARLSCLYPRIQLPSVQSNGTQKWEGIPALMCYAVYTRVRILPMPTCRISTIEPYAISETFVCAVVVAVVEPPPQNMMRSGVLREHSSIFELTTFLPSVCHTTCPQHPLVARVSL